MSNLEAALKDLLNQYSAENRSGTPDLILAQYLEACLLAFDTAVQQRETWYGRDSRPLSPDATLSPPKLNEEKTGEKA